MHKYFKSDWIQRNNKDSKEDKSRNVPELFSKYAMSFLCRKTWNKISVTYAFNNQSAIWKKTEMSIVVFTTVKFRIAEG